MGHTLRQLLGLAAILLPACGAPPAATVGTDLALADTLKKRIEEAYDFTRPGVLERMNSLYPSTGKVISASGGHFTDSGDSLRAGIRTFWEGAGKNMQGPRWVWGKVDVERLAPDAAVLVSTWSIPHVAPTGRPHTIQGAWTAVFRNIDGKWMIVIEHLSTPPEGTPPPAEHHEH